MLYTIPNAFNLEGNCKFLPYVCVCVCVCVCVVFTAMLRTYISGSYELSSWRRIISKKSPYCGHTFCTNFKQKRTPFAKLRARTAHCTTYSWNELNAQIYCARNNRMLLFQDTTRQQQHPRLLLLQEWIIYNEHQINEVAQSRIYSHFINQTSLISK